MKPVRILVDSMADEGLSNAQISNAREIIRRLDPEKFHVSVFHVDMPDSQVANRPNTRLIPLPSRGQTPCILNEFLRGSHKILFYLKCSPSSKWYLRLRSRWKGHRCLVGTVESQSDLHNEPTVLPATIRLWEQTILRCDHLFSNSRAVRRSLKKEYGLDSGIIPTGVDTSFFAPIADRPPNPRPRVLFAGSLRPFKQPDLLLDAAVRFPRTDFVIAGDGIMKNDLLERIRRDRLANVSLKGMLTAESLRVEYQRSDIFLFPSQWEGSPKVILEAAACGLPVIARSNYEPETVVDGESGYLVGSTEELFYRLEALIADSDLRQRMGEAGRNHSKRFDWDLIVRSWEDVFLELASPQAEACA